jgi:hypothetical protein
MISRSNLERNERKHDTFDACQKYVEGNMVEAWNFFDTHHTKLFVEAAQSGIY